ncbi:MAG: NUDIX hydrolase [Nanoarchaeota archaeon]|nr:NUDIX hydrolase [Nanoarchaeota archaeon]
MTIIGQKIVLINSKDKTALFLKRSNYKGDEGLWDLPGGRLNEKEDLKEGIIREVEEEIQVKLKSFKPLDAYSNYAGEEDFYFILYVSNNFSYINSKKGIQLSSEHTEYKWCTYKQINQMNIKDSVEKVKPQIINYLKSL